MSFLRPARRRRHHDSTAQEDTPLTSSARITNSLELNEEVKERQKSQMKRNIGADNDSKFTIVWEITVALLLIATGYATFLRILMDIFGGKA
jgi:hypothetical protein